MKILKFAFLFMLVCAVAYAQWVPKGGPHRGSSISTGKADEKGSTKETRTTPTVVISPGTVQPGVSIPSTQPLAARPVQTLQSFIAQECAKPLEIEIVEPRDLYPGDGAARFVPGRSARNYATFDEPVTAQLRVNGGIGGYTWTVRSAVEEFSSDMYCDDPSRCMPHMFSLSRVFDTEHSEINNTYNLSGSFSNSLPYCMDDPVPTVIGLDGTAAPADRRPATGPCMSGNQDYIDDITISVTDNCSTKRTVSKTFTFFIQSPSQHVSDLIAAEIRLRGNDFERGIDYVYLKLMSRAGDVAKTFGLYPAEDHWKQYRLKFETKAADVPLRDINHIKLVMMDMGRSGFWIDADVDYVMVYSKYWYFYCEVDENFEVTLTLRENYNAGLCSSPRLKRFAQPIAEEPSANVEAYTRISGDIWEWQPW